MKENDNIMDEKNQIEERKIPLMITIINFGIQFKPFLSQFCNVTESNCYVLLLFKSPYPQGNTVFFVLKEIKYLLLPIATVTAVLCLN